jgi:hypothetical protein
MEFHYDLFCFYFDVSGRLDKNMNNFFFVNGHPMGKHNNMHLFNVQYSVPILRGAWSSCICHNLVQFYIRGTI